jgi:hypothetical protein
MLWWAGCHVDSLEGTLAATTIGSRGSIRTVDLADERAEITFMTRRRTYDPESVFETAAARP